MSAEMGSDLRQIQQDVWVAAGHESWTGDLLITTSRTLIANRKHPSSRLSNICTATEAGKILGLYLRFRQHGGFHSKSHIRYKLVLFVAVGATFQPLHFSQRALGHSVLREFEGASKANHSISQSTLSHYRLSAEHSAPGAGASGSASTSTQPVQPCPTLPSDRPVRHQPERTVLYSGAKSVCEETSGMNERDHDR